MAGITNPLFVLGLLCGKRYIEIAADLFGILEVKTGGLKELSWRQIGKRGAAIVRTVRNQPGSHGSLPKICSHECSFELLQLFWMTIGLGTGLAGQLRVKIISLRVSIVPEQGSYFVQVSKFAIDLYFGNQFKQTVVAGRC